MRADGKWQDPRRSGDNLSRCFLLFSKDAAVKKKMKGTTTNAGRPGGDQGNGPHPPPPGDHMSNSVSNRTAGISRCNLRLDGEGGIASWMYLVVVPLAGQLTPDARARPHLTHYRRYAPRTARGPGSRTRWPRFLYSSGSLHINDTMTRTPVALGRITMKMQTLVLPLTGYSYSLRRETKTQDITKTSLAPVPAPSWPCSTTQIPTHPDTL